MFRMVSFAVLIAVILVIGVLFFKVMATFLVPLFFAALLVVMFRPLHHWVLRRCRGRQRLAAGLTTAAILLIVLVPALVMFTLAGLEASSLVTGMDVGTMKQKLEKLRRRLDLEMPLAEDVRTLELSLRRLYAAQYLGSDATGTSEPGRQPASVSPEALLERAEELQRHIAAHPAQFPPVEMQPLLDDLRKLQAETPGTLTHEAALQVALREFRELKMTLWGGPYHAWLVDLANPSEDDLRRWSNAVFAHAQEWLLSVGGATTAFVGKLLLGTVIMAIALFFFLLDGPGMTQSIMRLSPLDDRYEQELLHEFDEISRAVVLATLLSAVVQGLLAGIGYWFAGLPSVFFLMLLTMVLALIPFLGAASVWVPVSLWLYLYEERTWAAVLLAAYGFLVVSMADNVVKPWVLHGRSKLHPLLALLSVLGGVQALGPIGILVGPMVVVFLQTLLNILNREMNAMAKAEQPSPQAASGQ